MLLVLQTEGTTNAAYVSIKGENSVLHPMGKEAEEMPCMYYASQLNVFRPSKVIE